MSIIQKQTNDNLHYRRSLNWHKMDINTNTLNQLPTLTDEHVIRSKIKKMKVKCAAQVFSARLPAYMNITAKSKVIP